MESDKNYLQTLMYPEENISRAHRIVDDYGQEKHARAHVNDWAKVILILYDSGRVRQKNELVDILHAENIELKKTQKTPKDVST